MLRLVLLVCVAVVAVVAADKNECHDLISPDAFGCCKNMKLDGNNHFEVKGCEMKPPPSCEGEICASKQLGLTTADDGTFNKEATEAYIRKFLEKYPENVDDAIATCVHGDLSAYGPAEYCDLLKLKQCLIVHFLAKCNDWEETDVCGELKIFIDQCAA
ncbi:hypothetical protein NE865_05302 [Phthorimaea operculella]|nr:hypothetical protein NE865_05302 [Phthorimaea operculella]